MGNHVLDIFMAPKSVAVIGVTRKTGKGSYNPIECMQWFGYEGEIYPVNPFADEILGLKCYRDIKEVERPVDLAVIAAPRERVPGIVEDCAAMGIQGAIVVPQGFSDADATGKALQERLSDISRQNGIRILGPNTLGVLNAFSGFTSSFMYLKREKTPVGVICQSGVFFVGAAVLTGMIGKGIDVANGCDIDFADCLEYFGDDDETQVIVVHMEGMVGGSRFMDVARRLALRKPVITYKTARTRSGAVAAASHSGSMAGTYAIYEAAFCQAGLVPASTPEALTDFTKAFLHLPLMRGKRVGLITLTGAGGIIAADSLEECGLRVARLSEDTVLGLKELSPDWMPIQNPMDIWPALMKHGMKHVYELTLRSMLKDPGVDGVICIAIAPDLPENEFLDTTGVIREVAASQQEKPVVAWLYGPNQSAASRTIEQGGHVLAFPSLPRATEALAALYRRHMFLQESV
ncbi:MAG: CoA-binding protein [Deltaproteobacteria bacterium]|nr:CoA-binding protein [Deltaproteobacteria bacterium]